MTEVSLREYYEEVDQLIEVGQYEQAIAHCRHILVHYPKYLDTYRLLGKAYLENHQYDESVDIFQRVLSSIPDDYISHIGMSMISEHDGSLDEAAWHMERAYDVQPSNKVIQSELRRMYGQINDQVPTKIGLTKSALARMYINGNLFPQAINELRSALSEEEDRYDLLTLLAQAYYLNGQVTESAETCKSLLNKLPYSLEANRLMAEILIESNQAESAKMYQQRVEELDPYSTYGSSDTATPSNIDEAAITINKLEDISSEPITMIDKPVEQESIFDKVEAEIEFDQEPIPVQAEFQHAASVDLTRDIKEEILIPATVTASEIEPAEIPEWLRYKVPADISKKASIDTADEILLDSLPWLDENLEIIHGESSQDLVVGYEEEKPVKSEQIDLATDEVINEKEEIESIDEILDGEIEIGDETMEEHGALEDEFEVSEPSEKDEIHDKVEIIEEKETELPLTVMEDVQEMSTEAQEEVTSEDVGEAERDTTLESILKVGVGVEAFRSVAKSEDETPEPIDELTVESTFDADIGEEVSESLDLDWLNKLAAKQSVQAGPSGVIEDSDDVIPEWLKAVGQGEEDFPKEPEQVKKVTLAAGLTGDGDRVADIGEETASTLPAWLRAAGEDSEFEGEPLIETQPEESSELGEWLSLEETPPIEGDTKPTAIIHGEVIPVPETQIPPTQEAEIVKAKVAKEPGVPEWLLDAIDEPEEEIEEEKGIEEITLVETETIEAVDIEDIEEGEVEESTIEETEVIEAVTVAEIEEVQPGAVEGAPLSEDDEEFPAWLQDFAENDVLGDVISEDYAPEELIEESEIIEETEVAAAVDADDAVAEETEEEISEVSAWIPEVELEEEVKDEHIEVQVDKEQMDLIRARNALVDGNIDEVLEHYLPLLHNPELLPEITQDLKEATQRFPEDASIWQSLGEANLRAGNLQEALEAFDKAEQLLG